MCSETSKSLIVDLTLQVAGEGTDGEVDRALMPREVELAGGDSLARLPPRCP